MDSNRRGARYSCEKAGARRGDSFPWLNDNTGLNVSVWAAGAETDEVERVAARISELGAVTVEAAKAALTELRGEAAE